MIESFQSSWDRFYGELAPYGWAVRGSDALYWTRFHSLPESKRYAEDESEWRVVLQRANTLASETLGGASTVWLVIPITGNSAVAHVSELGLSDRATFQIEDEEGSQEFAAGRVSWNAGKFDPLIRDIADDRLRALWFDPKSGTVFAPYDGGTDLFLPTVEQVEQLRANYPDWLSSHPLGL